MYCKAAFLSKKSDVQRTLYFIILGNGSTGCVERVHFKVLKEENSAIKEALNSTRLKLDELRKLVGNMNVHFIQNELLQQKKAIANLTTLASITINLFVS